MGLLEAVVVIYLRRLLGVGVAGVSTAPGGPVWTSVRGMELAREVATLAMIVAVAWLAGRGWRQRLGAFAFVFGSWDLAYYGCLLLLVGWPSGLLDWDLLFLIPAPWWGPVLAPVLVAAVLVVAGLRFMLAGAASPARRWAVVLATLAAVALVGTFVSTSPPHFAWAAFLPSLVLFSAGLLRW